MRNKHSVKLDLAKLENDIDNLVIEYLAEITEENVQLFSEKIKFQAETFLENYYLNVDNYFTQGKNKIKNEETLNCFAHYADGYRAKMKTWRMTNGIKLEEVTIPENEIPEKDKVQGISLKRPLIIGGIVAVGVFVVSGSLLMGLFAGLLATGISYLYFKKQHEKQSDLSYKRALSKYEIEIAKQKQELINQLKEDIRNWLTKGEEESDRLLTSFNI